MEVAIVLQITHGTAMCMLALFQFVRQSYQMYRVTKQWQLNRYMNLLVGQGILYFIVYVPPHLHCQTTQLMCHSIFMLLLIDLLIVLGKLSWNASGWQMIPLVFVEYVPMYTLTPRFIMGIRETYTRDVQGRRGSGIDIGFGLSSGRDAGGTVFVFADVEQNERSKDVEEIPMEVGTTQPE